MDWKDKAQYWIAYESQIEAALHPVFVEFLNRTGLAGGQKVLDIGCGSGGSVLSAADLVGPSGSVTGVDIAPHMTARAGERTAHLAQVDFLTGDAQVLQFEPAKYDIAMSLFGMMFYGDPAAAFSNILSAVRPAGRIVFVAWASGQDNPWFSQPGKAAAMHIPDLPQPDPHAPGPMAFADTDRVLKMLGTAGWSNAKVEDFDLLLTPTSSPGDIAAMLFQFGPLPELIRARCSDDNDAATLTKAIRAEIAARLATYDGAEGVRVPAKVRFFSAQRPG